MIQEEKFILLQDLSARLPYQPICEFTDTEDNFCTATAALGYSLRDFIAGKVLIKPYLRPLSSMTEEEYENFRKTFKWLNESIFEWTYKSYDWLNKYHFDYRGLIEKGLTLEALDGMYNIKHND